MNDIELSKSIISLLMVCVFSILAILVLIGIQSSLDEKIKIEPTMKMIMIVLLVWLSIRFLVFRSD